MQFNSLEFLVFCLLFFSLWPQLRRGQNGRWAFLVAASFLFYGWWDWRFLLLLVGSGLVDFYAAAAMVRWPGARTACLAVSLIVNLGTLATFKYLDFLTVNVNLLLTAAGADLQFALPRLLLPVGISFYTFQSMSYTIDVYRGSLKPTGSVLHFFAYLSLFPQLVAGPILRAADLLPQLEQFSPVSEANRWRGTQLIAWGLFKKLVIADAVALICNSAFAYENVTVGGCVFWWLAATSFAVQIYCDFSGYSDIARGLACWMGFEFAANFDHPYAACGLRDFWGRWHISLSSWFRDYVYIPLGGSRGGPVRGHVNLWLTMMASGIWHGANWTFVAWGALHAFLLSLERLTRWPDRMRAYRGGGLLATLMTLALVVMSWVVFRAESIEQAIAILGRMIDLTTISWRDVGSFNSRAVAITFLFLLAELRFAVVSPAWKWPPLRPALQPVLVAAVLVACVYLRGPGGAFIYFQF